MEQCHRPKVSRHLKERLVVSVRDITTVGEGSGVESEIDRLEKRAYHRKVDTHSSEWRQTPVVPVVRSDGSSIRRSLLCALIIRVTLNPNSDCSSASL
ncbi:hypothetical protein TNCV_1025891 [Trichonephila clavipes]|nr:hypothetical protein TNCV_1025891 [Trichonephila clavipes]